MSEIYHFHITPKPGLYLSELTYHKIVSHIDFVTIAFGTQSQLRPKPLSLASKVECPPVEGALLPDKVTSINACVAPPSTSNFLHSPNLFPPVSPTFISTWACSVCVAARYAMPLPKLMSGARGVWVFSTENGISWERESVTQGNWLTTMSCK